MVKNAKQKIPAWNKNTVCLYFFTVAEYKKSQLIRPNSPIKDSTKVMPADVAPVKNTFTNNDNLLLKIIFARVKTEKEGLCI